MPLGTPSKLLLQLRLEGEVTRTHRALWENPGYNRADFSLEAVGVVSATQKLLRFGVFELNVHTEELFKSAIPVKLPPQPLKLLILLASSAGQVVARDEIQQQQIGRAHV